MNNSYCILFSMFISCTVMYVFIEKDETTIYMIRVPTHIFLLPYDVQFKIYVSEISLV